MRKLEEWMCSGADAVGLNGFSDVHVDELDPSVDSPDRWLDGLEKQLTLAWEIAAAGGDSLVVVGCISLRSDEIAIGLNFGDAAGLREEMDFTPPSLYLLPSGAEPWLAPRTACQELKILPGLIGRRGAKLYYMEYKEPAESIFRRCVWVSRRP